MNENKDEVTMPLEEEFEPIMPDGYGDGDDFFDSERWGTGSQIPVDGQDDMNGSQDFDAEGALPGDVPEENAAISKDSHTIGDTDGDGDGDNAVSADEVSGSDETTERAAAVRKLKFTAKIDHNSEDVELDESELPTIYQKSRVADRLKDKLDKAQGFKDNADSLAKAMGYENADEMIKSAGENFRQQKIDELMEEGNIPREIAEDYVDRQMKQTAVSAPRTEEKPQRGESEKPGDGSNGFAEQIRQLFETHPEARGKTLPDEVARACVAGENLVAAYERYQTQQSKAETEKLQKENRILKQNASAAAKAPVKGVSGGGKTDTSPKDPFLEGFDSDDW